MLTVLLSIYMEDQTDNQRSLHINMMHINLKRDFFLNDRKIGTLTDFTLMTKVMPCSSNMSWAIRDTVFSTRTNVGRTSTIR